MQSAHQGLFTEEIHVEIRESKNYEFIGTAENTSVSNMRVNRIINIVMSDSVLLSKKLL